MFIVVVQPSFTYPSPPSDSFVTHALSEMLCLHVCQIHESKPVFSSMSVSACPAVVCSCSIHSLHFSCSLLFSSLSQRPQWMRRSAQPKLVSKHLVTRVHDLAHPLHARHHGGSQSELLQTERGIERGVERKTETEAEKETGVGRETGQTETEIGTGHLSPDVVSALDQEAGLLVLATIPDQGHVKHAFFLTVLLRCSFTGSSLSWPAFLGCFFILTVPSRTYKSMDACVQFLPQTGFAFCPVFFSLFDQPVCML